MDEAYYRLLPILKKYGLDRQRETVKKLINRICKKAGITRESINIVAGSRAELYFNGEWSSVSYDHLNVLSEKGTDLVAIEKEGICEIVTEYADKYGIALLNTRGHLTEYCEALMIKAKSLGAHVVMISDYEYTGVKIVSETPTDVSWIGVNDEMLRYFHLQRESVEIDDENDRNKTYVEYLVKNGKHPQDKDLDAAEVGIDGRFSSVDLEFLGKLKRVEINAVLAAVESENFWEYIMHKLKQLYPKRDYNRSIELPSKYELNEFDILPYEVAKVFLRVQSIVNVAVEEEENAITTEQANVEGFIEVAAKRKENSERLAKVLMQDKAMKVVISECKRLMLPGILPQPKQRKSVH